MNMLQALNKSVSFVKKITNQSKIESKIEAEHIFMYVLQIDKKKLYEQYNTYLSDEDNKKIKDILELRKNKPLSYIINKHTFYKEDFYVNQNVGQRDYGGSLFQGYVASPSPIYHLHPDLYNHSILKSR